jgi:hypothetical protein
MTKKHSELNFGKNSQILILSSILRDRNFDVLLTFPKSLNCAIFSKGLLHINVN